MLYIWEAHLQVLDLRIVELCVDIFGDKITHEILY